MSSFLTFLWGFSIKNSPVKLVVVIAVTLADLNGQRLQTNLDGQRLQTKNPILKNFYIGRRQIHVEIRRNPASSDFFLKILKKSLQNCMFCRLFSSFL